MGSPLTEHQLEARESLPRLLSSMMRRYSRDPESRPVSARHLASYALRLLAAETSPGEAALAASETLAALVQEERRR